MAIAYTGRAANPVHALGFNTTPGTRVGGVGMLVSRRWGLALVLVASLLYLGLGMLGSKGSTPVGSLLWMFFSLWLVVYCGLRLIGREGPRPL